MAVAVTIDIRDGTAPLYEQVIAEVFPEGKLPDGWLMHVADVDRDRLAGGEA